MRPESEAERAERHARTVAAFRAQFDPDNPPWEPYTLEQHFSAGDEGDFDGLSAALQERGFQVESLTYDPADRERTWRLVVVRLELVDEQRLLRLSDEMDGLARQFEARYEGWATRVDEG
ncbi:MAG: ribonuclease E inhibitor RraB [Symbiobacterium sp.]|uniref:ribonuclease E inhibitor RraB n=1 Tax=Symbiobacterium sp. TaxID=1971213 RepID=UPI003464588C